LIDRLLKAASIVGLLFLTFVGGAFVTEANVFPARLVGRAYFGAKAVYDNLTAYRDVYTSRLWYPERSDATGVTVNSGARTAPGYTLYTSGHDAAAYLVDMEGRELYQWHRPYSTVWRKGEGPKAPKPDTHVWFRAIDMRPNGDLLAVYEAVGDTPYGYGLVKLDRDSNVLWTYFGRTHHALDVGRDGRIYALSQEVVDERLEGFDDVGAPRLDDYLVVLSPDGEELENFSLTEALARSTFRYLLQNVSWYGVDDPTHTNSVQVLDARLAANFPFGKPGQVLLSMRELNAVLVVDVPTASVVWATRGSWIQQHDAQVLPSGHILMFDNWGNYERRNGISRVIEVDPRTTGVVWQYTGTPERPLASDVRATVQPLPNGNRLVSESAGGRLLEVTRGGEIVWEFINPHRGGDDGTMTPIVDGGQRLDPATFDPDFRALLARSETHAERREDP
jgi:hypothetical protein